MMRTLIDTNILIALEDDHVLGDAFSQFHREASKSTVLLVHPSTKVDIEQDKPKRSLNIINIKSWKSPRNLMPPLFPVSEDLIIPTTRSMPPFFLL
jgi:hypothetical protein